MLETILEKVLINNLGMYIDGLDKKSLKVSIWSGDIVIENISVKSEVLNMLEMPVKMNYSFLGKLKLSIPWKSLGSKPVEVSLENIYVILEPINEKSWIPVDYRAIHKRIELMEMFVNDFTKKIMEGRKKLEKDIKKEDDKGMVARMTQKVLDNLQVSVQNIHLRFENPYAKRSHSWGITLDQLLIKTCNEKWEPEFLDRTDSKYKLLPLRKNLTLKNLGFYWNSPEETMVSNLKSDQINKTMNDMIMKSTNKSEKMKYIIDISATCNLIQRNELDPSTAERPDFEVSLMLDAINIKLSKSQLEDIIRLLELFSNYDKFKIKAQREKSDKLAHLKPEEYEENQEDFKRLFRVLQTSDKIEDATGEEKLKKAFNSKDLEHFEYLIQALKDEDIANTIKEVLVDIEKQERMKAVTQQKEKENKKGFFSWGSKKSDTGLNEQDMMEINKYLAETFAAEEDQVKKLNDLGYRSLFNVKFELKGGQFHFCDTTNDGTEEGVGLSYTKLQVNVDMSNKGKQVSVSLNDYKVELLTKAPHSKSYSAVPVIRRVAFWKNASDSNILELLFDQNPKGQPEGNYINLTTQPVEIIFRPVAIERLKNFFDISSQDESLKSRALEGYEGAKDVAANAAIVAAQTESKKNIKIKFAAPTIIIPFRQDNNLDNECWVLNLGDLNIASKDFDDKQDIYEHFGINLNNIKMQYYPTQDLLIKTNKLASENKSISDLAEEDKSKAARIFNLVENFTIELELKKILAKFESNPDYETKAKMDVDIKLPELKLNLTPSMYSYLMKTSEFIQYSKENSQELMENERTHILADMSRMGILHLRETKIKDIVWNKYTCVLKGTYLYFFKDSKDLKPSRSVYIRGAVLKVLDSVSGRDNVLLLENRYNKAYLAADTPQMLNDWKAAIEKKINEFKAVGKNIFDDGGKKALELEEAKKAQEESKSNPKALNMTLKFVIKKMSVALRSNDAQLIDLVSENFDLKMNQYSHHLDVNIGLQKIEMNDYLFEFTDPNLKKFIVSKPVSQDDNTLISIGVRMLERTHPDYQKNKTDLEVAIKFGFLNINFKPDVIATLMRLYFPKEQQASIKSSTTSEPEIVQKKAKESTSQNVEDPDHIMIKLSFSLREISLKMIHQRNHICLAKIQLNELEVGLVMKPLSMEVQVGINNIQLFDTTNYPNTIDSNLYYDKIVPYEMIGTESKSEKLVSIKFKSIDTSQTVEKNIYSFVEIDISSIQLNLLQQPLLRLIDYLTGQMLPSVTQGIDFNAAPVKIEISREDAAKNLEKPQFMDIKLNLKTPVVTLKPLPTSTEFIKIRLGDLIISNHRNESKTRSNNPKFSHIWCEEYTIELKNMGIVKINESKQQNLCAPVNFTINFEMVSFEEEYKVLHRAEEGQKESYTFDSSKKMRGHMTPMQILLLHSDFLLLMKCLFFNIAYDDLKDEMILSNYKAPTPAIEASKEKTHGDPTQIDVSPSKASMTMDLFFENFSFIAVGKDSIPFAKISLDGFGINMKMLESGAKMINVKAEDLTGAYFEYSDEKNKLYERKMMGDLALVIDYDFNLDKPDECYNQISKIKPKLIDNSEQDLSPTKRSKPRLEVGVTMNANSSKEIRVELNQFKIFLATNIYLRLLDFASMDDSVYPKPPEGAPQESTKSKEKTGNEDQNSQPSESELKFDLKIAELLLTMPSGPTHEDQSPNVFSLKSDILLKYSSYPYPDIEEFKSYKENKIIKRAIDRADNYNSTGLINLDLNNTELFICNLAEMMASGSEKARKRYLIMPFSFKFIRNNHAVLNLAKSAFIDIVSNKLQMFNKLVITLSYQDLMLLQSTMNYHLEQLSSANSEKKEGETASEKNDNSGSIQEEKKTETKKDEEKKENSLVPNDINPDDWVNNLENYSVNIPGIQIILINDAGGTLVPALEFSMFKLITEVKMIPTKIFIDGLVFLETSFYNSYVSRWEPIIEPMGFEFTVEKKDNPQLSLSLSVISNLEDIKKLDSNIIDELKIKLAEELNVNISEEMLSTINYTMKAWSGRPKTFKRASTEMVPDMSKSPGNNLVEYSSPYKIENGTGYPIQIFGINDIVYDIENRTMSDYVLQYNMDKMLQEMRDMSYKANQVDIQIKHSDLKILKIKAVDIDTVRVKRYDLYEGSKRLEFGVYVDVKIVDSKKIISVTSPVYFKNHSSYDFKVKVKLGNKEAVMELKERTKVAVPIDLLEGEFSIERIGTSGYSKPAPLKNYIQNPDINEEVSVGDLFINQSASKKCEIITEIILAAPIVIKNCLPLEFAYQVKVDDKEEVECRTLQPQESRKEFKIPRTKNVSIKIRIAGFKWSKFIQIFPKQELSTRITLEDQKGNLLDLFLSCPSHQGSKSFFLYTKAMIVNETGLFLNYWTVDPKDKKKVAMVPGRIPTFPGENLNSDLALLDEPRVIRIKKKDDDKTGDVVVATVGDAAASITSSDDKSLIELGINISLTRADKDNFFYTKVITLSPRYIIINKTNNELEVKREEGQGEKLKLEKEKRTPFYFLDWDPKKRRAVSLKIFEEGMSQTWEWSGGIPVQDVGVYNLMMRSTNKEYKLLKITISIKYSVLYLIIEEQEPDLASFKIKNDCPDFTLKVYQDERDAEKGLTVESGSLVPFAWTNLDKMKFFADFSYQNGKYYHSRDNEYEYRDLHLITETVIPKSVATKANGSEIKINSTVMLEGGSKILRFYISDEKTIKDSLFTSKQNSDKEVVSICVRIEINSFGLSIISNITKKGDDLVRKEVLYMCFKSIQMVYSDSNLNRNLQFRIKFLQIDNNTTYDTPYPILFTPTNPKDLLLMESKSFLLDFVLHQKPAVTSINYFEQIELFLDSTNISVDGTFLDKILQAVNRLQNTLSSDDSDVRRTTAQNLFYSAASAKKFATKESWQSNYDWEHTGLVASQEKIFIRKLKLNPFFFNITFQLKKKDSNDDAISLNVITNVLGAAFANLDNAPIKLHGLQLENIYDTQSSVINQITNKYKADAAQIIFGLVGSLDIVGNPVGLFKNIGSGVKDLIEKPAEGFVRGGPLEGGKGIILGAGSMLKNTVSGSMNTIGKVTGSLASGFSSLTMDSEYMAQREQARLKRPKNIGDGLKQGVTSIGKGLFDGVTGIFTKPVEGAKKEGALGFFKGAIKGVAGVVVKPITGGIDALSKTAEGIKSQALIFDQKASDDRMRLPRAFYGSEKFYTIYLLSDAEILYLLHNNQSQNQKNKTIVQFDLLSAFDIQPDEGKDAWYVLALTLQGIIWWDSVNNKLLWWVKPDNIADVSNSSNEIRINLFKTTPELKERSVIVKNSDAKNNKYITKKLEELIEYYKSNK